MIMVWVNDNAWRGDWKSVLGRGLAALSPALSYGLWSLTPLAEGFFLVEKLYFSRRLLAVDQSFAAWSQALMAFTMDNPQAKFYYALEFAALLLGFMACILLFKRSPEISTFGLAMIVFAFTSGAAQGMVRYVLAAPPLFWILADWGRRPAFDRVWSLASILLMGMQAMLFSFDFWVA
jgi:hypothetical protein